jgi:integrase
MGRIARELGPLAVSRLTAPGLYFVGGVAGLALQISPSGARSWVLRVVVAGKRRDMGLGAASSANGLAHARGKAQAARDKIRAGIDPIEEARSARSRLKAQRASALTFKQCAEKYIAAHQAGWKNDKHAAQWGATLQTYAYPVMGSLLVRDVDVAHVTRVLEPIWQEKTETASRVRGRIQAVLDWAAAHGYRPKGLNPAAWKGHLDKLLPRPSKVAKVEHHSALPIAEVGSFMAALAKQEGISARALEFAILTAARSGEVRVATWSEMDLQGKLWTIAAERMKAGREHRVPLSDAAVRLLKALPREEDSELVFAAPRGGALSDMALTAVCRRMKVQAVPHGFRSSFRDWASERTNVPRDVAEMALAHAIPSKVEAAYRRGDLFEKRRKLMQSWSEFCAKVERQMPGKDKVADVG